MGLFKKAFGGGLGFLGDALGIRDGGVTKTWEGLNTPTVDQLSVDYVAPEYVGDLSSNFNNISVDPRLQDVQMSAIDRLIGLSEAGGFDDRSKARMDEARRIEDQRTRGAREAILDNAAAKGSGGSGVEMLNLLTNAQMSADRTANNNTQVLADAEQRALDALISGTNLASNVRGQEFQKANYLDAIDRFNNENRQTNLNARAGATNASRESRANAYQTDYGNRYDKTAGVAGAKANRRDIRKKWFDDRIDAAASGGTGGVGGAGGIKTQ